MSADGFYASRLHGFMASSEMVRLMCHRFRFETRNIYKVGSDPPFGDASLNLELPEKGGVVAHVRWRERRV